MTKDIEIKIRETGDLTVSEKCNECRPSLLEEVRSLYTELAIQPEKDFGWGKGKENARALGYNTAWLERLPDVVWESAAAVGNPFSLGPLHRGETIVDLGCGAGADVCVAAFLVGNRGQVIGVDITPAMVEKARANAILAGLSNVQIHESEIADLPLPDVCADVVISNGTINLSPRKPCVLKEAFRILKSGGRFQIADMVREADACQRGNADQSNWAGCVAGTMFPEEFLKLIKEAGFVEVELVGFTGYRTSPITIGAHIRASTFPSS
jgi:SAM-dependent methyltransferase